MAKFDKDGNFIEEFGKATNPNVYPPPKGHFHIPHSVALVEDWNLVCVADRENQRIQVRISPLSRSSHNSQRLQCLTAGLVQKTEAGRTLPAGLVLKSAENLGRVFAIRASSKFRALAGAHQAHNALQTINCLA